MEKLSSLSEYMFSITYTSPKQLICLFLRLSVMPRMTEWEVCMVMLCPLCPLKCAYLLTKSGKVKGIQLVMILWDVWHLMCDCPCLPVHYRPYPPSLLYLGCLPAWACESGIVGLRKLFDGMPTLPTYPLLANLLSSLKEVVQVLTSSSWLSSLQNSCCCTGREQCVMSHHPQLLLWLWLLLTQPLFRDSLPSFSVGTFQYNHHYKFPHN